MMVDRFTLKFVHKIASQMIIHSITKMAVSIHRWQGLFFSDVYDCLHCFEMTSNETLQGLGMS